MGSENVGLVVKLDRGYPLVRMDDGTEVRCKHATALVKGKKVRAVIGDYVCLDAAGDMDKARLTKIEPRRNTLVRKDPTERALPQVLAANFDTVLVAHPLAELNMRRLERELVLAHETGANVVVVLTKADLAESDRQVEQVRKTVDATVGDSVKVLVVSDTEPDSVEAVRAEVPPRTTAVLIGRSGVGKSSLVNMLCGREVAQTAQVREGDGKGRHTTVSREMIELPNGGMVVDMPGVRGLGLWEAEEGIDAAFADIGELAMQCRFRDCSHGNEPGCAVREAVEQGRVSRERLDSFIRLKRENEYHAEKKRQRGWK